jgi:hypothetical protein
MGIAIITAVIADSCCGDGFFVENIDVYFL